MPIKKAQLQHFTVLYCVAHYTVKSTTHIKKIYKYKTQKMAFLLYLNQCWRAGNRDPSLLEGAEAGSLICLTIFERARAVKKREPEPVKEIYKKRVPGLFLEGSESLGGKLGWISNTILNYRI